MLVEKGREESTFVDPADPTATPIAWQGRWRTLTQAWTFAPGVRELHDGLVAAQLPEAAVQHRGDRGPEHARRRSLSSALVAYGFARFRFPGRNILFIVLIATIILPFQVTLIPTYVIFTKLGWNGTWLPLIVPHLFANAFNVFLLRQYFMSIPRDLDEAAMIDGAEPVPDPPLGHPAAVGPGDRRGHACSTSSSPGTTSSCPLLYLAGKPELQPLSIGIQQYNALYVDPADADPGRRADDDGRAGRRVLPRPARVHARRRRHRRREVSGRQTARLAEHPGASPGSARSACRAPRPAIRASTCR